MAVTKILVYITCLCFARDFVFCDDYEEIGNEITLTPSIRGKPEEILWKHNENKVLEYDGSEVVGYGSFKGRVVVDFETGQLTIQKLNSQDSGQYQSDIVINGKIQSSSHTLTVLDALAEPQVSCELDETSNVKKLVCSVESQTPLSYEWSGPNINGHSGPELVVDKQEENLDSVYNCTVKNHVNSKSTEFTLKDCHTGREGSAVLVPVLIVAILLILLIALAIFLYILYRRKKQKQARPSESKNMDPENGSSDDIATFPSHNRLPSQKESIADKKWSQDKKNLGETEKLLKESQEEEEKEKSQILKQESENGEKSPEHQNETLEEQKTEDNNRPDTETASLQSSVTEINTDNEAEQVHENENEKRSQNDDGGHQNESPRNQKTEDAANSENDMRPGETKERSEEKNHEGIDRSNTAETCRRPSVDQPGDGEAPSAPAAETCRRPSVDQPGDGEAPSAPAVVDSPANLEKEPIKRSVASSIQPDLCKNTDQDKKEERKCLGLDQDEKGNVVTNQEEKGGQE